MNSMSEEQLDLLTAYALGALEPEEMARVGALLQERPELQTILAELRAAADLMPYALDASPPEELRQRTLDRALGRSVASAPAKPIRSPRWAALFGALAGALAVVVALLWSQLAATQAELARTREAQNRVVAVLAQPNALVQLRGAGGNGAIVRRADGTVVMAVKLPGLSAGRVYQLWLLRGKDAPAPSDTFVVDQDGMALVTLGSDAGALTADTFAITNEPHGGSSAPTSDILLVGSVVVSG
jgi:anti-sigma factor RsiW